MKPVIGCLACLIVFIWLIPAVPVSFFGAILIALFGFFFAAVSARMVGIVGSSNNPISGMTIATLVVSTLVLKETGTVGAAGMVAAIAIGSVVCIVAAIAVVLALLHVPVMPVAIGLYLPVGLSVTMFVGGLLRWGMSRMRGEGATKVEGTGTLFSAGLVAGEGLCGIILALLALI